MVSFKVTDKEKSIIRRIATRATERGLDQVNTEMDVTAVHANSCPLDLEGLFLSSDFDFLHDIYGIRRHLNRTNGRLLQHFRPRCAVKVAA